MHAYQIQDNESTTSECSPTSGMGKPEIFKNSGKTTRGLQNGK